MSAVAELVRMPEGPNADFNPLFEKAPYGIAICYGEGKIGNCNPALERILQMSGATICSLRLVDLFSTERRYEAQRLISSLQDGNRDSFEIEGGRQDEDAHAMRWTVWRTDGVHGAEDGMVAVIEEHPDKTVSDDRLRQAQRLEAIGRLAGGVAHDFNNLLTGVLLYSDLLMASANSAQLVRKYAEEIRKAGLQAAGVVRQLLAVARPANCQPRLLSLNEVAEAMRNLLARLIGENIELSFHLDPQLELVKMDPAQAQQILLNLILNSRDALPGGGRITVETGNCKIQILPQAVATGGNAANLSCVFLLVSDNGYGMDDSTRARALEPFFTTKNGKGTGLGLATVNDIVTTSGGLIYIDSRPAAGTRVRVLLPVALQTSDSANDPHSNDVLISSQIKE